MADVIDNLIFPNRGPAQVRGTMKWRISGCSQGRGNRKRQRDVASPYNNFIYLDLEEKCEGSWRVGQRPRSQRNVPTEPLRPSRGG